MELSSVTQVINDELVSLNKLMEDNLQSDTFLTKDIFDHILANRGKQLRPILIILCRKALGYRMHKETYMLGAAIELIHCASLLHDDVVDTATLRRNKPTVNKLWGNKASILIGDLLYSKAFKLIYMAKNIKAIEIIADATNIMAEGEMMQLENEKIINVSIERYIEIISKKTAKLFQASCLIGAHENNRDNENNTIIKDALSKYGYHLGLAFQLIDDILDYSNPTDKLGKNTGEDLKEGKATLPLIYAYNHCKEDDQKIIEKALRENSSAYFESVKKIIVKTKALEYTKAIANKHINFAKLSLESINFSAYKSALENLATFTIERTF